MNLEKMEHVNLENIKIHYIQIFLITTKNILNGQLIYLKNNKTNWDIQKKIIFIIC
jgi:hypothetical protein